MTSAQKLERGWQLHQAQDLAAAEALYREVLQQEPNNPPALHLLGLLAQDVGNLPSAVQLIGRAAQLAPQVADFQFNYAATLERLGRAADAAAAYQAALRLNPNVGEAQNNLGHLLLSLGRPAESEVACRAAVALLPHIAATHNNLGNALRQLRRHSEAADAYRAALRIDANFADAWLNLGNTLMDAQRFLEAAEALQRAQQLDPVSGQAFHSLGVVFLRLGRLKEAEEALMEVIVRAPQAPEPRINLGNVLTEQGRFDDAIETLQVALKLQPGNPVALNNLANAQLSAGQSERAIQTYRESIAADPSSGSVYTNLGNALKDEARADEAVQAYREALRLNPTMPEVHSNLLYGLHFLPRVDRQAMFEDHLAYGRAFAQPVAQHNVDRNPDRRLRVGLVSPDLRDHPVGRFVLPIVQHHDRANFEYVCFSDSQSYDDVAQRLREHAKEWYITAGRSHDDLAEFIRSKKIDILIDLAGHTGHTRLPSFARKPAPLQMTYLGYPNTTGLAAIDYRLTDAFADPPGESDRFHTEQLIRLPECAWCFAPPQSPDIASSPSIANGYVTFGSFNNFAKVNSFVLDLWARVLHATPDSRLLLKAFSLRDGNTRERFLEGFAQRDISPDRIEAIGSTDSPYDHLKTYGRIDVALDTFPYHGTTTTCEALWMGVPVITLAGQTHAARVGVSLLNAISRAHWIAWNEEAFISLTGQLATNRELLSNRSKLRDAMRQSNLCNFPNFTRAFEVELRKSWRRRFTQI